MIKLMCSVIDLFEASGVWWSSCWSIVRYAECWIE